MKKTMTFFCAFATFTFAHAQVVKVTATVPDKGANVQYVDKNGTDNRDFKVPSSLKDLKTFSIEYNPLPAGHKLIISAAGTAIAGPAGSDVYDFAERNTSKAFTFNDNVINKLITIKEDDGTNKTDLLTFRFLKTAKKDDKKDDGEEPKIEPISDYLGRRIGDFTLTKAGWVENGKNDNVTHMFFDEYGNNLLGAIPQGISNRQYVVHIIYKGFSDRQDDVKYSVKQKSGSFNSGLVINNSGSINKLSTDFQSAIEKGYDEWHEEMFPLGIATDDLGFDITVTTVNDDNKPTKVVLESYTIKMAPVYHATIDVGLLKSELNNTTFTLTDAIDNSGNKIVKETDKDSRGVVTAMATFYTSPIVLLRKIVQRRSSKQIPDYKLTGRSFFDDHSLFERIYPAIGLSINAKAFENLFYGFNWEIARGLSIFGGKHWGKVNTFEMSNFTTGTTYVTKEQFDFYSNKKWKTAWAYGVKLDVTILTNLFRNP